MGKEVERLKAWQDFETWKGLASSRKVSIKAGEVTEKIITEAYVNRFNAELKALGADRVRVSIVKTRIERGKAMHQLKLSGTKGRDDDPASLQRSGVIQARCSPLCSPVKTGGYYPAGKKV